MPALFCSKSKKYFIKVSDNEDESTIYLEIKALFGIDDDEGLRWVQFSGSRKGASFPKCR